MIRSSGDNNPGKSIFAGSAVRKEVGVHLLVQCQMLYSSLSFRLQQFAWDKWPCSRCMAKSLVRVQSSGLY